MSQITSPGLKFRPNNSAHFRIGCDELAWAQYESQEQSAAATAGLFQRTGLVIDRDSAGQLRDDWKVAEDPSNAGYLVIGTTGQQSCVDDEGYVITIDGQYRPYTLTPPRALALPVPNDSVWRTLVVRRSQTAYEPGTLAFTNGDKTVTGTGTMFTRYTGRNETVETSPVHGTYIRVDVDDQATLGAANPSGQGAGRYEIDSVTSDTELELVANATATASGVPFSIAGSFYGTAPAMDERDIHLRRVPEFELVTRTRLPAAGDVVLADVQRAAGVLSIIDRRDNSLAYWKTSRPEGGADIQVQTYFNGTSVLPQVTPDSVINGIIGISAAELDNLAAVTPYGSSIVIAYCTASAVSCKTYSPRSKVFGSAVSINASTTSTTGVAILRVPGAGTSYKHICAFDNNGVIYVSSSTDDCATWGTPAAVWDVSALSGPPTLATPSLLLLRDHRIVLSAAYTAGGATTMRCVVSDDYGTSWTTNTNAGYVIGGGVYNTAPRIIQDPVTGYLTKVAETSSSVLTITTIADETATAEIGAGYTGSVDDTLGDMAAPCGLFVSRNGVVTGFHYLTYGSASWIAASQFVYTSPEQKTKHVSTNPSYYTASSAGKLVCPVAVETRSGDRLLVFLRFNASSNYYIDVAHMG